MLTRDDLIDLLVSGLAKAGPETEPSSRRAGRGTAAPSGPKGRPFLSAHDIRKRLTAGENRLTIPRQSIVSPLALEELILRGIEVVRE